MWHELGEAWRRSALKATTWRVWLLPDLRPVPNRLIVAPTDLRMSDPFVAEEMSEGRYMLAGRRLETDGQSPFSLEPPSQEFAARLNNFSWLRHVRATRSDDHFNHARRLANDWILLHGRRIKGLPWQSDIAAQRLIAWLSHSTILLKNADIGFYRRFLRSMAAHVRYLEKVAPFCPHGEARMQVRIALAMASLAIPSSGRRIRLSARHLDQELGRQILADGGHISRNPRAVLDLLLDLLPLRQTYINLGHDLPPRLIPTIDRMFPALRFFRHQGGELALFNGATATMANELMSVLRYDESTARPFRALPHSQYQRLAAGDTVILVDTGLPLSTDMSRSAHAGCLSLEMSSGKNRFIVNSGSPRQASDHYRQVARATAAHSTLTINDTSSSRIARSNLAGPVFIDGVMSVDMNRADTEDGADRMTAAHDGYVAPFGLIHERTVVLSPGGDEIQGTDRITTVEGDEVPEDSEDFGVIRFHIHPQIHIEALPDNQVRLTASDGERWRLSSLDVEISIEEDVFFADASGMRASQQLELAFSLAETPEVQWLLKREPRRP